MSEKCVLFTGSSGLNVRGSLKKFSEYCARQRKSKPMPIILDDKMIDIYLEQFPEDPSRHRMKDPGGFQYLLLQPKDYLLRLWRDTISATLLSVPSDKEDIFFFIHSVFYHNSSRDFFCCVDFNHLVTVLDGKGQKIDMIITLVDDIYDVWRRLKERGQLFSLTDDIIDATLDLFLLLNWRSVEIFASAQFARTLNVPHYVISLKQPLSTIYDLIFSNKIPVYVAHPITEVRKLERNGYSTQANEIIDEIRRIIEMLAGSDVVVPIFPTGIDELIFKEESKGVLLPELLTRWPHGALEDILFIPPEGSIPLPLDLPGPRENEAMKLLIRGLSQHIEDQISSRDRTLVEQTGAIIAWRPFYNGRPSSGVSNEVAHRNMLIERKLCSESDHPVCVLSRLTDLVLYRIDVIYNELSKRIKMPRDLTPSVLRGSLRPYALDKLGTQKGTVTGEELSTIIDPDGNIDFQLPLRDTGALRRRELLAKEDAQTKNWAEIASEANKAFPPYDFYASDMVIYDDSITVGEFVHRVEEMVR